MVELMTRSDNIDFTPSLRQLFANARHDYFRAQQAYLIFSLIVWADLHAFVLKDGASDRVPMAELNRPPSLGLPGYGAGAVRGDLQSLSERAAA